MQKSKSNQLSLLFLFLIFSFTGIRQGLVTVDNKAFCLKNCTELDNMIKGDYEAVNSTVALEK